MSPAWKFFAPASTCTRSLRRRRSARCTSLSDSGTSATSSTRPTTIPDTPARTARSRRRPSRSPTAGRRAPPSERRRRRARAASAAGTRIRSHRKPAELLEEALIAGRGTGAGRSTPKRFIAMRLDAHAEREPRVALRIDARRTSKTFGSTIPQPPTPIHPLAQWLQPRRAHRTRHLQLGRTAR